ncbi:MAG: acyl-CoA dehydrogenase family protein [Sphingopyxis sp.]|nr:acyl-CoA dehydrogenase family protein [Sphingopyxis sp.]
MDFNDTAEEAAFREEARGWLAQNAAPFSIEPSGLAEDEYNALCKKWQAVKYDGGYAAITWPVELGGRGGSPIQQVIYNQEESRYQVPSSIFAIGLGICIQVVNKFGSDDHRERYVQKALRGEEIWCQLFSEPAAGSDVAGIRTSAVREGDGWRVKGQKVWTSGAHFCDFGILLVRTDPDVPKHKGLTMFIVDMKAPGVTIRPLKQINGRSDFNEVFFDDVFIPDTDRLGAVGEGWHVCVSALMFERHAVGNTLGFLEYNNIMDIARDTELAGAPAISDGRIRERIVDMYINSRAVDLLTYRAQTALSRGTLPGPEQSIVKAIGAYQGQQASYLAMDLRDQFGMLAPGELGEAWGIVEYSWTWGAAMRIAGGSDEILRNIIAERVLGLPGDIRVDKDVPYRELAA